MTYAEAKMDTLADTDFRIGRVISKSLQIFFQHFLMFTFIAGVIGLPAIFLQSIEPETATQGQGIFAIAALIVMMFFSPLATAIILHATFQHMRGRPVSLSESVSRGLARFLPLLGLMVLYTLGFMLGFILLVIPGLILMTMWYVAVPACVVEHTGPARSLGRSRELTKGYRWRIFAMILIVGILTSIGNAVVVLGVSALGSIAAIMIVQTIWQGIAGGFTSALVAVAYYYLRVAKEGVDVEQIAAVFD